jgi:hypothetical protein
MKKITYLPFMLLGLTACAWGQQTPAAEPAAAPAAPAKDFTSITLDMPESLPEDVFTALGQRAGVKFVAQNLWMQDRFQETIDVNVTDQPFWQVVRDLCVDLKLMPVNQGGMGDGKRVYLQPAYGENQWATQPSAISKGFLVQAMAFQRVQSVQYASPQPPQDQASVQLMVYVDPALRIASMRGAPKVTEAIDDAGNNLVRQPRKDGTEQSYGGGYHDRQGLMMNVQVPLQYPEKPGKKITSLKFNLTCRVIEEVATLTFDKLDAPSEMKAAGDLEVAVKSLKTTKGAGPGQPDQHVVTVQVKAEDGNNIHQLLQQGKLLDAKGQAFNNNGVGGGGGGRVYTYQMMYSSNGGDDATSEAPVKWVLELPTKYRALNVPVELKDLPLP